MALLVGRYINKIDKKGRVSVPKAFRKAFERQEFNGVYSYPLFKSPTIEVCSEIFMTRLSNSLDDLDMFSDEQDDLGAIIMNNAEALPLDLEGRIVLPNRFLHHTEIKTDTLFVGRGRRFQIWNPDLFERHNKKAFERARAKGVILKLCSKEEEA
tara:strand:+ start:74 stop:538 length:465 start_codon:yes stop_codon:yes gene_type:complete